MNALVIPTNRPERLLEFLDAWDPWPWDRLYVIEDGPAVTLELPGARWSTDVEHIEVMAWRDIDAVLPHPEIISRQDSAIRAFGFWRAWRDGADVVFTLDDDCHPTADDLVAGHLGNLDHTPAWRTTVPGLRVRGLPYRNLGRVRNVAVSVGLWLGCPDVDAVQALAHGPRSIDDHLLALPTIVMPSDQYFPMSGMNVAVRREVACLMYYPPMGLHAPYRRFDDIWCGIVLQRICRHLRMPIVCGRPLVEHRQASDPFVNLEKEASGIAANERIWEAVDAIALTASSPLDCMREAGAALRAGARGDGYLDTWGRHIAAWCALFTE